MELKYIILILCFLWASVAALVVPALYCFGRWVWRKYKKEKYAHAKDTVSSILLFSGFLLFSVWCLRYAVGFFSILTADAGAQNLTWWEEMVNSVLHALQTFSMDEDYTQYLFDGKQMLATICGPDSAWVWLIGAYASVLNFVAPIAGGAVIFEILASIFPRIKLFFLRLAVWREKYYFSELNEAALALAESVCAVKVCAFKRPVIIFTDTYVDEEDEKGVELLLKAKALGAICMRDDLAHVHKNRYGKKRYFLIDAVESNNLHTLANLAHNGNNRYLKDSEIYLFTNDDAYVQVESNVRRKLCEDLGYAQESDLPVTFVPVLNYRNLISNMLVDIPLYEPLIGKKKDKDGKRTLTVSILGTGHIGTEMFLSTYWFGQMLDVNLNINVLSQESEEQFWGKIKYVNPEIWHTTQIGDETLRIYPKKDTEDLEKVYAPPYCTVKYRQCDVKSVQFMDCLTAMQDNILDTDYYLVALGSDEDNISVANTVRKYVGQHHINAQQARMKDEKTIEDAVARAVIAYVVYDSELSDTMNSNCFYNFVSDTPDIYMRAVGSLDDVYSVRTVFMTEYAPFVDQIHDHYLAMRQERAAIHKKRMANDYKYWANMARKMHLKYKIYSAGLIKDTNAEGEAQEKSIFDYANNRQGYDALMKKACEEYKKLPSPDEKTLEWPNNVDETGKALSNRMAWLEHRRWCAFTRIKGFRCTTAYDAYATINQDYKQMDIKLHPCLVECDDCGIRPWVMDATPDGGLKLVKHQEREQEEKPLELDLLDELSEDLCKKKYNDYDFKIYDYPGDDF